MTAFLWILFIAGGFLSGSILWSEIIPKVRVHKDICAESDDGNPGAFNVFSSCGKKLGAVCLTLDIVKGLLPVLVASFFLDSENWLFALVAAAPVLGHALGIFNRMHGGKAIAVSFGAVAGLLPVTWYAFPVLALLYILFSTALKIPSHRIRSIVVYALFAVLAGTLCGIADGVPVAMGCVLIAAIIIVKHLIPAQRRELLKKSSE